MLPPLADIRPREIFEQGDDCTTPITIPIMRISPPSIPLSSDSRMTQIRKTAVGRSFSPGPQNYRSKWSSPLDDIDLDDDSTPSPLPSRLFGSSQSRRCTVASHSPSSQAFQREENVHNTSTMSQGSSTLRPSPARKVFTLISPTKFRSCPISPSISEHYTPPMLLQNMDTLGIEPMDEKNPLLIVDFFREVLLISGLLEARDKIADKKGIPGYQTVLENWVKKKALGPIPSNLATLHLGHKVRINIF